MAEVVAALTAPKKQSQTMIADFVDNRSSKEAKVVEIYDPETQLEVVEYKKTLDGSQTKLPWSKIETT